MLQVDFLPVGDGEASGDAIAARFDYPNPVNNDQVVIVIDGGYRDNGLALQQHINEHYGTNRVDLVISTHPDADHINGLVTVLEVMEVGELMMHLPWQYTQEKFEEWKAERQAKESFIRSINGAELLARSALERGIPITEPFTDEERFGGILNIVGPDPEYYAELLPRFGIAKYASVNTFLSKVVAKVVETLNDETLTDAGETSAKNSSSALVQIRHDGKRLLFTGDAGQESLTRAISPISVVPLTDEPFTFFQAPHHGSHRNLGPTVLDGLIGPPGTRNPGTFAAFISASKAAPKHPSKRVTNALHRRGARVVSTEGIGIGHGDGVLDRPGWGPATPIPFHPEVENDD